MDSSVRWASSVPESTVNLQTLRSEYSTLGEHDKTIALARRLLERCGEPPANGQVCRRPCEPITRQRGEGDAPGLRIGPGLRTHDPGLPGGELHLPVQVLAARVRGRLRVRPQGGSARELRDPVQALGIRSRQLVDLQFHGRERLRELRVELEGAALRAPRDLRPDEIVLAITRGCREAAGRQPRADGSDRRS